jgi:hypothetical protein
VRRTHMTSARVLALEGVGSTFFGGWVVWGIGTEIRETMEWRSVWRSGAVLMRDKPVAKR